MNILRHKSWHVRNKDNIERVRRDEENARKEEEEKLRRVALAESEARTGVLRERAKTKRRNDDEVYEETAPSHAAPSGHVNFFEEEEQGMIKGGTNAEYEKEQKEEKEKREKAVGLLKYLGQDAVEGQTSKPWYYSGTKREDLSQGNSREESDMKNKSKLDPMFMMRKYVNAQRKLEGREPEPIVRKKPKLIQKSEPEIAVKSNSSEEDSDESIPSKHKKKHKHKVKKKKKSKKHKKEKKSDRKEKCNVQSNISATNQTASKTMAQLRAERLQRELAERQKTEKLFSKLRGEKQPEEKALEKLMDDRSRGYNSQFNPEFVRKPKKKKDYLNMI